MSLRRAEGFPEEVVDALHDRLGRLVVTVPKDLDARRARAKISEVRDLRNVAAKVVSAVRPRVGKLRADLVRIERSVKAETALRVSEGTGLFGTVPEKKARVEVVLHEWLDARAETERDLCLLEEVLEHARVVREELRCAFEEASRSLSAFEIEWKIAHGER